MLRLRFRDRKAPSRLEARFERQWAAIGGPPLEREFRFDTVRKWRADFAHIGSKTLIEIEGGIWISGRHNRAAGFLADIEKYLEATLAGWAVVRLADCNINVLTVQRIVRYVTTRQSDNQF